MRKTIQFRFKKIFNFPLNVVGNTVEQWVAQRRLVLLLILPIWKIVRSSPLQFQHCRIWSVCIKEWFISHFCHLQWSLVANWLLFFCQPPAIFLIATCSFHRLGRQIAHYHGSLVRLCFFPYRKSIIDNTINFSCVEYYGSRPASVLPTWYL